MIYDFFPQMTFWVPFVIAQLEDLPQSFPPHFFLITGAYLWKKKKKVSQLLWLSLLNRIYAVCWFTKSSQASVKFSKPLNWTWMIFLHVAKSFHVTHIQYYPTEEFLFCVTCSCKYKCSLDECLVIECEQCMYVRELFSNIFFSFINQSVGWRA